MNDRVRRQEEARGWHRALEREDYHDDRDNQDMPRFHLSEGQRSFLNKARGRAPEPTPAESATSLLETLKWWYEKARWVPDAKEHEHDRRLRGQYE